MARGDTETYNDLDFLVEFIDSEPKQYSKMFSGLLHSLEDTFHCDIDLLTIGSIRKPSVRRNIEKNRICLYEGWGVKRGL